MKRAASPKYAWFMMGTFGVYFVWTLCWSPLIARRFRIEKNLWKRNESFLLEQTLLYEPVK